MDTPRYVFGAQGFGVAWTADNVDHLMNSLREAGIHQFDTAALYPATNPGESEELLGKKKPENAIIDTKVLFIGDDSVLQKPGRLYPGQFGASASQEGKRKT
jgi:aflatoxin B1 aldehyde reductase